MSACDVESGSVAEILSQLDSISEKCFVRNTAKIVEYISLWSVRNLADGHTGQWLQPATMTMTGVGSRICFICLSTYDDEILRHSLGQNDRSVVIIQGLDTCGVSVRAIGHYKTIKFSNQRKRTQVTTWCRMVRRDISDVLELVTGAGASTETHFRRSRFLRHSLPKTFRNF